jgi:glycyl-tRNA synthetase beta chain
MPRPLVLEIGSDEIPARYLPIAISDLKKRAITALTDSRLGFEKISTYGTPRRLVLFVDGLKEAGDDLTSKVRGPSAKAAFDQEGNPTKALSGFARSLGIDPSSVTVETENGGKYVYGTKHERGRPAQDILKDILPGVIMGMECPHSMRWGDENWRWYRPIRWVVCLFGHEVVEIEVAGRTAGRVTFGHRTLHPGTRNIPQAQDYFSVTRSMGVEVCQERRKEKILADAAMAARELSGVPLLDEDLVSEVVSLCEHPSGFLGRFDNKYLRLPKQILVTAMRHHQRYFPIVDEQGRVLPGFVGIRDGDPVEGIDTVRVGNEWVLRARLEDAEFFYDQDTKVKLEDRLEELQGVRFLRDAGTLYHKTERLMELTKYIGPLLPLNRAEIDHASEAARLSKCDLVTAVVREFPELEGTMGGIYGRLQGHPEEVTRAISEQYLPRGVKDSLPGRGVSSAVALADKIDTLAVAFSLGVGVSGSQDPLGLRRTAYGIVSILMDYGYDVDCAALIQRALDLASTVVKKVSASAGENLWQFLMGRVEAVLTDRGYPVAVTRAVMGGGERRFARYPAMAKALLDSAASSGLSDIVVGWRRTSVLGKGSSSREVSPELLQEPAERNLYRVLVEKSDTAKALYEKGDYAGYLAVLANLRPFIDQCLDEVLIMAKEEEIKENRLRLLGLASDLFTAFADFREVLSMTF